MGLAETFLATINEATQNYLAFLPLIGDGTGDGALPLATADQVAPCGYVTTPS